MHNVQKVTKSQSIAIQHGTGPMLVLAGPGSGKTFVITHRISHLVRELHIDPQKILVITFTKAAALEMQERCLKMGDEGFSSVCFGTFHAVFYSILKNNPKFQSFQVIKETEKYNILKNILNHLNLEEQDTINSLLSEISKCKNLGISPNVFQSDLYDKEQFEQIFYSYQKCMQKEKKIDFDDMLLLCRKLLKEDDNYLSVWQNKFSHILIDEYQDINPIQFEVIRLLAQKHENIFVVGDDDQSIYGFRGSKPELMLQFPEFYPNAKIVNLEENFRCGRDIVKRAGLLISHNEKRFLKQIVPTVQLNYKVKAFDCENRQIQAEQIVTCIQQYMKLEGSKYKDIAIIYRTNSHVMSVLEKMMKENIPFQFREKPQNIYETEVGKDILAYIRYAVSEKPATGDFYRIMNRPVRYIKRDSIPRKDSFQKEELIRNQKEDYVIHNIIQLYRQIDFIREMSAFAAINYIRKGIGYDEYLREQHMGNSTLLQKQLDILDEIQEEAREHDSLMEWLVFLNDFSVHWNQKPYEPDENAVRVLTMHASKGLEWKVVLLPDINESFMPHKKAITENAVEEERRLLYVAMTRAKEYLFLFYIQNRGVQFKAPSRFLREIFPEQE